MVRFENFQIHERILPTLGDTCPFYDTVRPWVNKSKRIDNALHPGSSKIALTPETIDKVHDMVLADIRVEVHELAEAVNISAQTFHFILRNELHMKKFCAKRVPRLLTPKQKRYRM